jgi:hypothetical protein
MERGQHEKSADVDGIGVLEIDDELARAFETGLNIDLPGDDGSPPSSPVSDPEP